MKELETHNILHQILTLNLLVDFSFAFTNKWVGMFPGLCYNDNVEYGMLEILE